MTDLVRTTVLIEVIERAAPATIELPNRGPRVELIEQAVPSVVEIVTRGPQGRDGGGNVDLPLIADQALSGHRVVRFVAAGRVDVVDSSDPAQARHAVGITLNAAVADDDVVVRAAGEIEDPSFSFTSGQPIYFTALGVLTHALPVTGFIQQVAIAASPTQIVVQLGPAIVLA